MKKINILVALLATFALIATPVMATTPNILEKAERDAKTVELTVSEESQEEPVVVYPNERTILDEILLGVGLTVLAGLVGECLDNPDILELPSPCR